MYAIVGYYSPETLGKIINVKVDVENASIKEQKRAVQYINDTIADARGNAFLIVLHTPEITVFYS